MGRREGLQLGVNIFSFLLFFAFSMAGIGKISSFFPTHKYMVAASKEWVYALYLDKIGMDDVSLRVAIGMSEIFLALVLLTPQASFAVAALMFLMFGAIFTHVRLHESPLPPTIMLGMLAILGQLRRMLSKAILSEREKRE